MNSQRIELPPLLQQIADPPRLLHALGKPLSPELPHIAIVGTRHPTPYGRKMADRISFDLATRGYVIVSGLAYGIDACAHEAALRAGGKTVAILGSGLHVVTPPSNRDLALRIQKNGTLISEYPDDYPPHKWSFPKRNRIIAGISLATIVIEAPYHSGALITARLALEYNREVCAVPGNVTQETSHGTNTLLQRHEAHLITCAEDVVKILPERARMLTTTSFDNSEISPHLGTQSHHEKIYAALTKQSMSIDELVDITKLPPESVSAAITLLEIEGRVVLMGSQAFVTR